MNTTLIIAIVGSCLAGLSLPATSSTCALGAMPQELNAPSLNQHLDYSPNQASDVEQAKGVSYDPIKPRVQDVEVKRLDGKSVQEPDDVQPALASLTKEKEDKWALDDDDRMTEEEMNKELFGDDDAKSKSDVDSKKLSGVDNDNDSDTDDKSDADREKLAPRQTIEGYLNSINSLTIDTYTPPSTSREGIDVPMKIIPPMMPVASRGYSVTGIRYQTPDIYHNPLYFEDRSAERGGEHQCLRQPIVSARKFAGDVLKLPRKVRKAHPKSCEYHQNLRYSQPNLIRN